MEPFSSMYVVPPGRAASRAGAHPRAVPQCDCHGRRKKNSILNTVSIKIDFLPRFTLFLMSWHEWMSLSFPVRCAASSTKLWLILRRYQAPDRVCGGRALEPSLGPGVFHRHKLLIRDGELHRHPYPQVSKRLFSSVFTRLVNITTSTIFQLNETTKLNSVELQAPWKQRLRKALV